MRNRLLAILAALVLVVACAVFSAGAEGNDVRDTFICPCGDCVALRKTNPDYKCPEISQWKSISTTTGTSFEDGGHYYVNSDTTAGGQLTVPAGVEAVLLIDNATLRYEASSGRMINMTGSNDSTNQDMILHVIGNNEAAMQYKYKGSGTEGPLIQVGAYDLAYFHLYGDLTVGCESGSASASNGGLVKIHNKGRMYIHDNVNMGLTNEEDPAVVGHTASGKGGAIFLQSGTPQFIMEAGTVDGGNAENGGAIYVGNGTFTMTGGTVNGGSAANGGAIYVAAGTANLKAGAVTGGTASSYGGSIYAEGGQVNIGMDTANYPNGPFISGGNATSRGGGIYVVATGSVAMGGGSISGCYTGSSGNGGAVYVRGDSDDARGVFDMSGGTITADGSRSGNSKGVRVQGGKLNLSGTATIVSAGGSEAGAGIDCLGGKITLDGAARVYTPEGKSVYDIVVRSANSPKVTVNGTWTGSATVRFNKIAEDGSYAPGSFISSTYAVSTGDYTGELYFATESTMPRIYGKDSKLIFADVAVVDDAGYTWMKDNAEALAVANNASDKYIKLFNTALVMNGETVYVDFCGLEVNVTGSGKIYGFDSSATSDGAGTATVVANGVDLETVVTDPVGGESYITITESGVSTFHAIKPVIDRVTLRPSSAGMYYTGKVICDETLASYVTAYGIALSVNKMPGADFETSSLFTKETGTLTPGGNFNGVLVSEIMKSGVENNVRAEMTVYANAYVTLEIGGRTVTYMSSDCGAAASMNLKTLFNRVNATYRALDDAQKTAVNGMYAKFKADMSNNSWYLNNIIAASGEDVWANDTDGIKILMIGNSLSVDAGRMLAYVFATEGYDNVRVSTLYKSGCKLWEHAEFIKTGEAAYTFYDSAYTDAATAVANPGSVKPKTTSNKTMLDGIRADDWDIIVMQQGSAEAALDETYNEDIQTIIDYVLENDKNSATKPTFVWNSIWGYPYNAEALASNGSNYTTLLKRITGESTSNAATQIKMVDMITQAAANKILTNENFAHVIPSGTAFIHACQQLDNTTMYNDYIHASDLGRLMISYVWYSTITGKPIENIVDAIPAVLMRDSATDRAVTAEEKAVFLDCIARAFADPYTMPTTVNG